MVDSGLNNDNNDDNNDDNDDDDPRHPHHGNLPRNLVTAKKVSAF